jgi:hypothetical protein
MLVGVAVVVLVWLVVVLVVGVVVGVEGVVVEVGIVVVAVLVADMPLPMTIEPKLLNQLLTFISLLSTRTAKVCVPDAMVGGVVSQKERGFSWRISTPGKTAS